MVNSISSFTRIPFPQEEFSTQERNLLQALQNLTGTIDTSENPASLIPQVKGLLNQIQHLPISGASSSGKRPQKDFLANLAQKLISQCHELPQIGAPLARLPDEIIGHIVQHIPIEGLKGFEGTCKKSHRIVNKVLSPYLDVCKETLALTKKNLEDITTLELDHDPYARVRPEDRDLPFQDIMRDIEANYQKRFSRKNPSLRYILTNLPSYIINPNELEKAGKDLINLQPPYFEKEYLVTFLQTIECLRQKPWCSANHVSTKTFLIKYFSLLTSMVKNEDPIAFQMFINDIQKSINSSEFTKKVFFEDKEFLTKIDEWQPSNLELEAIKFHDFLCALFRIPCLEPALLEIKGKIEQLIHDSQRYDDLGIFLDNFLDNSQSRMLLLSIAYGRIEAQLKQHVLTDPYSIEINCLLNFIRIQIPPNFPRTEIVKAFGPLVNTNHATPTDIFLEHFISNIFEPNALPYFSTEYFLKNIIFHKNNAKVFSETHLFLLKNTHFEPRHVSPPPLAFLATQHQTSRMYLNALSQNKIMYDLTHIPFLLPQLVYFGLSACQEKNEKIQPLMPLIPSTFRYCGPSLTKLTGFDTTDLPPSFSTSQSPAIQNILQIERQRRDRERTVQKIAHRTIVEIGHIALAMAIASLFKAFTK